MDHVLGIDIGTSSCKATLLDPDGVAVSAASEAYGFVSHHPDWAEQDAVTWRVAAAEAIRRVRAAADASSASIRAVGVTGQMHTAVTLDAGSEVIRAPLMWCDQRATDEAAWANEAYPELRGLTLNPLLPAFTLAKLLWSRTHEPEAYRRVRHVVLPKDLLRYWLTGALATDASDAAGTGLFDARAWRWSDDICDRFEIPSSWLPEIVPSRSVAGLVDEAAAAEFGLLAGTPVVAGAGDQAAQALGLLAIDERVLAVQVGTSGVIVMAADEPLPGSFCHAIEGRWIRLDSLHSAGASLVWLREVLAGGDLDGLIAKAATVSPGADGMLYVPFLMGERAGFGASVPAAFVGLQPGHRDRHFVRALLEGIALELRRMFERWSISSGGPSAIHVAGGGTRHLLQLQTLADVFELPVIDLDRDSSYGAAVLAGMGIGMWQEAPQDVGLAMTRPSAPSVATLGAAYARYRSLYEHLRAFAGQGGLG